MAASGSMGAAAGNGRSSLTLLDDIAAVGAAGWATDGLMPATGGADTSAAVCDVAGGRAIETGASGVEALDSTAETMTAPRSAEAAPTDFASGLLARGRATTSGFGSARAAVTTGAGCCRGSTAGSGVAGAEDGATTADARALASGTDSGTSSPHRPEAGFDSGRDAGTRAGIGSVDAFVVVAVS
jgi:hypothetical protein